MCHLRMLSQLLVFSFMVALEKGVKGQGTVNTTNLNGTTVGQGNGTTVGQGNGTNNGSIQLPIQKVQHINWTNRYNFYKNPGFNYWKFYAGQFLIYDIKKKHSAIEFQKICTTREDNETGGLCYKWETDDYEQLYYAKDRIIKFQAALHQYYDITFQLYWVAHSYVCGFFLISRYHFDFTDEDDIHLRRAPYGVKVFVHHHLPHVIEEVRTIIQTDSEDEMDDSSTNNLSDYIVRTESWEIRKWKADVREYGLLVDREICHMDEVRKKKLKSRFLTRKKRGIPNINRFFYCSRVRNLKPPPNTGKKFDEYGTPKYPYIIEMRRPLIYTNYVIDRQ